jgi:hypothetical protein
MLLKLLINKFKQKVICFSLHYQKKKKKLWYILLKYLLTFKIAYSPFS